MYKPSPDTPYEHIDALFSRDKIDWELIARHSPDMYQVAQSIQAGVISPSTILRKLGSGSRKNRLYFAFRELGRVIRTISLLSYLSDVELQRTVTTVTNKCESFNKFAKWAYFAGDVIKENVRDEQIKVIKYNHLVANLLIFHNVHSMSQCLREMADEGVEINPAILGTFSPHRTGHLNRFGRYDVRDREVGEIDYALGLPRSGSDDPTPAR